MTYKNFYKLLLPAGKNKDNFCQTWSLTRNSKAQFFLLLELDYLKNINQQIFVVFQHTLEEFYRAENFNLEVVLLQLNSALNQLVHETSCDWLKKMSAVVAILKDDDLEFSLLGSTEALLVSQNKNVNNLDNTVSEKPDQQQFFSNISSGKLSRGDQILFTTSLLLDYVSLSKLKSIIENDSTDKFIVSLKNILISSGSASPFGAILIGSINDFVQESEINKSDSRRPVPIKTESRLNFLSMIAPIFKACLDIAKWLIKTCRAVVIIIREPVKFKKKIKGAGYRVKELIKSGQNKLCSLTFIRKILLSGIVLLSLVLFCSISILKNKKQTEQENQVYKQKIAVIEEKLAEAEAAMIYRNETKARKILISIDPLVNDLSRNSEQRQTSYQILVDKIQDEKNKINHINQLESLVSLFDFTKLDISIQIDKIFLINDRIYTFNSQNNLFYFYDTRDRNADELGVGSVDIGHIVLASQRDDDSLVLYNDRKGLAKLDVEEKQLKIFESDFTGIEQVDDFDIYNKRLYILDSAIGQIFKLQPTLSGYSRGAGWFNGDSEDLKNAVSMAIDSNVFVLNSKGQLIKLNKGYKVDFELDVIDPPLERPMKVLTNFEFEFLYILEPRNQRIVIFDKHGNLQDQYVVEALASVSDFAVDEKNKFIYFLSQNKLYKFDL